MTSCELYAPPALDERGRTTFREWSARDYCCAAREDALHRANEAGDQQTAAFHERRIAAIEAAETRQNFNLGDLEMRLRLVKMARRGN